MINIEADKLNENISKKNANIFSMLSEKGKSIYFPKMGIMAQSLEAKGKKINATAGVALEDNGDIMCLSSLKCLSSLSPQDIFPYESSMGNNELRKIWQDRIYVNNPSLSNKRISLPLVSAGLTHGLRVVAEMFVEEDDEVIVPAPFWDNYELIFGVSLGAKIANPPLFKDGQFNVEWLESILLKGGNKKILLLNFPNNPTGYTPKIEEIELIMNGIKKAADRDKKILVIIDDAYFDLVYEDGIYRESIFSLLADLHENVLAVKIDGVSKEDYSWGLRVGFITYACLGADDELLASLESKTAGIIRASVSNVSHLSQTMLISAFKSEKYSKEKREKYAILKNRFEEVKTIVYNIKYQKIFEILPFNSGYFMCVRLKGDISSDEVRRELLEKYDVGVIALDEGVLRIAYSAVPCRCIKDIFENIYDAVTNLNKKKVLVELKNIGFNLQENLQYNLNTDFVVAKAVLRGEGELSANGALTVKTGKCTGRSPKDRFFVCDGYSRNIINWNDTNIAISEENFSNLYKKMADYLEKKEEIFVFDGYAGADVNYSIKVRVINELASESLFVQNLLRKNIDGVVKESTRLTVICAPGFQANAQLDGTKSEVFIILNLSKKIVLIGGTRYAGEIKKAIFTYLNILLPQQNVLPMHCAANIGKNGDSALFFGLSGTGKTSISTDAERSLLGDDEHGWSEKGIFNFEGGCYAKCIDLNSGKEPGIFQAIRYGALVENVVMDSISRNYDFSDRSLAENTRAGYPLEFITNIEPTGKACHPKTVIFLTADAFGVLPPIAKLTRNQAIYYFLSGYTSKLAGTERGVISPQAVFSAFFGDPFMPLAPIVYADLLKKYLDQYSANVFLVNTGWIGGAYGVGRRIDIIKTRMMVKTVLDGKLNNADYRKDLFFGLLIPKKCEGVEDSLLDPQNLWKNRDEYVFVARKLASMFRNNFEKFANIPKEIKESGPNF